MILLCSTYSETGGVARVQDYLRSVIEKSERPFRELVYNTGGHPAGKVISKVRFIRSYREYQRESKLIFYTHPHLYKVHPYQAGSTSRHVVFTHGMELYTAGAQKTGQLLQNADYVITNSKYNQRWLTEKAGLQNVLHIYYPGLETRENENKPEAPKVLCVGRMMASERYKGHEELLSAWPLVLKSNPEAELIFCGLGDDVSRLKKMAHKLGVVDSVVFTGRISDDELIDLYANARLFAMPSSGEGQGLVWLEAMQAGLPVIATKNTVAEEFITHGENGYLVNSPSDKTELSDAILKVLGNGPGMTVKNRDKLSKMNIRQKFEQEITRLIREGD